jgi:hypothetical protein
MLIIERGGIGRSFFGVATVTITTLFTTKGAALKTGLSTRRLSQLAQSKRLPSITLDGPGSRGPQRVYREEDLDALIQERQQRERKSAGVK